jgi:hypothetical protein
MRAEYETVYGPCVRLQRSNAGPFRVGILVVLNLDLGSLLGAINYTKVTQFIACENQWLLGCRMQSN